MPTEEGRRRLRSGRRNDETSGSNGVGRPLPYLKMMRAVMVFAGIITCPQVVVMGLPMGTPDISMNIEDGRDNEQQGRDNEQQDGSRHNSGVSGPVQRCLHGVSRPALLAEQVRPSRPTQRPRRPDCVATASSSGSSPPLNSVKTEMDLDEQRLKSLPKKLSSPKIVKRLVKAEYWSTLRLALVRFDDRFSRSALRTMSKMTIEATEGLGIFEGLVKRYSDMELGESWDCNLLFAIVGTVIEFGLLDQYKVLTKCNNSFMRGLLLARAWCLVNDACLFKLNKIRGPSEYPPGHPLCDWKPDYDGSLALAAELGILQTARGAGYPQQKAFERIAVEYNQLDMLHFLIFSGGATMKTLRELHSDDIFTEERKKATEGNTGNATAQEAPKEAIYKYLTNMVSKPLPLELQCVLKLTSPLDWGWDRLEKIQRLNTANPIKDLLSFRVRPLAECWSQTVARSTIPNLKL